MVNSPGIAGASSRTHFKRNKFDALDLIVPSFYTDEEITVSGLAITPTDTVVNSHINMAVIISSILPLSATTNYPDIANVSGIAPFFVKQNDLTRVTPFTFERDVMSYFGYSMASYDTSAEFKTFLSGTLLPSIELGTINETDHESMIDALGWLYLLNTAATPYSPSSYVLDQLMELYIGNNLTTKDGVNGLTELAWRNYSASTVLQNVAAIPSDYVSGTSKYTSGTQGLDRLKTLNDVIYSPLHIDSEDRYVEEAFTSYITVGTFLDTLEPAGPLYRFLKAVSYAWQDFDNEVELLNTLYSIETCPEEFLPYMADLIGWKLLGPDPNRWRLQLRNAVQIYKAKGTKAALQIAVNSIFSADTFDLSSRIGELHESYVPYILYYALTTSSNLTSGFDTFTKKVSNNLNLSGYSKTNMDTNVRYMVDKIIYDLTLKYPEVFVHKGEQFCFDDPTFVFNYRDRDMPFPPWEEFRYYEDCLLTSAVIGYLEDQLVCYGVDLSFAGQIKNYILDQTLNNVEDFSLDNRWLFFTSGQQLPPNQDQLLWSKTDKLKYLTLWNGKSSHFDLSLSSTSFSFAPLELSPSTSLGLTEILKCVDLFIPAHAIPLTKLFLDAEDGIFWYDYTCPKVNIASSECIEVSGTLAGFYSSGLDMSNGEKAFSRSDSLAFLSGTAVTSGIPRNSYRTRNYSNLLPKTNMYIRDGWSMPMTLKNNMGSSISPSGYMPLGLVPSTLEFTDIVDYNNLPPVWSICENLNSSSVINEIPTSGTFPVRGNVDLVASTCSDYITRGDLAKVLCVMWDEFYDAALADSSGITASANTSAGPDLFSEYEHFTFGTNIHKFYDVYTDFFLKHGTSPAILSGDGGFNVFSHTYGPTWFNGELNKLGSESTLATTSMDDIQEISQTKGTLVSSVNVDLNIDDPEYREADIISGVEIVQTSGQSPVNKFEVYKLADSQTQVGANNFAISNGIVLSKVINGFPRLRFDMGRYDSSGNSLNPDHTFQVDIEYLLAKEGTNEIGGGAVGVWIHTHPENGKVWSFNRNRIWEMTDTVDLDLELIHNRLSHIQVDPTISVDDKLNGTGVDLDQTCIPSDLSLTYLNVGNAPKELYSTFSVHMDTLNYPIELPDSYFKTQGQVHSKDQRYIIEVFKFPSKEPEKYCLFNALNVKDTTLSMWAEDYDKDQVLDIIRYFNDMHEGLGSRVVSISEECFEASGGSRINYRAHPTWEAASQSAGHNQYTEVDFTG